MAAAVVAIDPVDAIVIEIFRDAKPKISIDELITIVREFRLLSGFEANWIILLLIKYEWDIEAVRAALISREKVRTVSDVAVNTSTAAYISSILYCADCGRDTLFVRADCSHDMCVVCVSFLVKLAMNTDSLPRCTQCEPRTLLNPLFIIDMLDQEVSDSYKKSLVDKVNSVHSSQSKAKRFLLKHKAGIAGSLLGGVGLLFIIFKIKGIQQAVEDWKVEHPSTGSGIDLAASMVSQGKDPLKPENMWKITKTVVKTAWEKYVQKYFH